MSRNIFNDATETELNQRTINFQNLSVLDATIPVLNTGNVVSGQLAGIAGLDLISKDTLDDIKDDVLGTRLKNLSSATISTESVATINGDVVNSTPVSTAGKNLMNITSIADLRSQILETSEEAVVFTADTNNEINFYTGSTQTASDLRLQLTNELIMLQTGDESMNIKLDNQSTWISFSEQLVFDNLEGDKINFYKTGSVIEDNLYKLEVDTTTGNTKTLVYVSPEEHLFQVRDTSTQPSVGVLQDILLLEKDHVHITSDNGIMINGGFNIKNGNHGELATTNGNKDLYYKTHGTGEHIFYVNDTTEILKVDSTGISTTGVLAFSPDSTGTKINLRSNMRIDTSTDNNDIEFYSPSFKFFSTSAGNNLRFQIKNAEVNYLGAVLKTIGNNLGLSICSTNATSRLNLKWNTNSIIESVDTQLNINTNSGNKDIVLTPHGTGRVLINNDLHSTDKISTDDHLSSRYYRSRYNILTDVFNEIEMVYVPPSPTPTDIMNFTFNKTESTSGNTLMSIDGVNDKIMTYAKLELHDDLLLNSNVDLASLSTQFQNGYIENVYVREVRVFGGYGGGAYIDLRQVDYTTDAGVLNTPPIYFNTGHYSLGQDDSELRKSMIIGSVGNLPTGELNTNSRNNILLCCRTSGDNQVVDIDDEKLRIGQNAVYINTDLIPKATATYDIGNANFKFVNGYIDNLFTSTYTAPTSHTFKQSTNDLLKLDNTENVSYRKLEAHAAGTGIVACANDGANIAAMRYNTGLGCEFAGVFANFHTHLTSQRNLYLNAGSTHNIVCNRPLLPSSNGGFDLGASGNKWKEIWATVSAINTSDRTKKKEINYEDIDDYADELLNLRPCSYKMIDGTSNRPHTGLIAQDMEGTKFEKSGCYIKTPKTKTITEYKSIDGGKTQTPVDKTVNVEGEYEYGLRYGELISPLIRLVQKQQEQINQLIKKVDLLEKENVGEELSFI